VRGELEELRAGGHLTYFTNQLVKYLPITGQLLLRDEMEERLAGTLMSWAAADGLTGEVR
jgi:hypothetical protein